MSEFVCVDLARLTKARRAVSEVIVHCTATPAGRKVTAADIDRWHRQRGFAGIGYHYVIGLDGKVWSGRSVEKAGAHCVGHNTGSIGVVYVGGLNSNGRSADTRTEAQKCSLRALIDSLRQVYGPIAVYGHRRFAAKDCPCFDADTEFQLKGGVK